MDKQKEYYEENKIEISNKRKTYYEKNKIRINKHNLEYYYANRDKWVTYYNCKKNKTICIEEAIPNENKIISDTIKREEYNKWRRKKRSEKGRMDRMKLNIIRIEPEARLVIYWND